MTIGGCRDELTRSKNTGQNLQELGGAGLGLEVGGEGVLTVLLRPPSLPDSVPPLAPGPPLDPLTGTPGSTGLCWRLTRRAAILCWKAMIEMRGQINERNVVT